MDAVFYVLLLLNFGLGALCLVILLTVRTEPEDPGIASLALPFYPLLGITALQVLEYYLQTRLTGYFFVLVHLLYDLAFILIAFFWNYIAYHHYYLNKAGQERPSVIRYMAGGALLLGAAATVSHLWFPAAVVPVHATVMGWLFYAGFRGIMILAKVRNIFPSSRMATTIAAISLVVYPAIAVGDLLGWRLPFLDPRIPFWVQAHPLYITAITLPLFYFVYYQRLRSPAAAVHGAGTTSTVPVQPVSTMVPAVEITRRLTTRENEILLLLYEGYRYREIAQRLFVSLTTVRTHVHHIYEKLDISRKEELFIVIRNAGIASEGSGNGPDGNGAAGDGPTGDGSPGDGPAVVQ